MIHPQQVRDGEHGVLRLFALEMRPEELLFLREEGALRDLLGVPDLAEDRVQLVPIADLEAMSLSQFLREGLEIDADQLAAHAEALAAITGAALLVPSSAFAGAATLTLDPRARHVVSLREKGADWSAPAEVKTQSAAPYSAPPLPPRQRRARATRMGAAIFAGFVLLMGLLIWGIVT